MRRKTTLSNGEWKIMNLLWEQSPQTFTQLFDALKADTGWAKGTVFTMLERMEEKGAVRIETSGRSKLYSPLWEKEQAVGHETESFLSRVYGGSLGLMVSSMAGQKALSQEDIDELYAVLREAEKEMQS